MNPKEFFGGRSVEVSRIDLGSSDSSLIENVLRVVMPSHVDMAHARQTLTGILSNLGSHELSRIESLGSMNNAVLPQEVSIIVDGIISRTQALQLLPYRSEAWASNVAEFTLWLMELLSRYRIQTFSKNDTWVQFLFGVVRMRKQTNRTGKGEDVQALWSSSSQQEIGFILIAAGILAFTVSAPIWVGVALVVAGVLKL